MDLLPGATQALCKDLLGLTAPSIKPLCRTYHMKRAHPTCPWDLFKRHFK